MKEVITLILGAAMFAAFWGAIVWTLGLLALLVVAGALAAYAAVVLLCVYLPAFLSLR